MKIDKNTINKIARLSRIKLDDKESEDYIKDLNSILDWVEQLNEVNTEKEAIAFFLALLEAVRWGFVKASQNDDGIKIEKNYEL